MKRLTLVGWRERIALIVESTKPNYNSINGIFYFVSINRISVPTH